MRFGQSLVQPRPDKERLPPMLGSSVGVGPQVVIDPGDGPPVGVLLGPPHDIGQLCRLAATCAVDGDRRPILPHPELRPMSFGVSVDQLLAQTDS